MDTTDGEWTHDVSETHLCQVISATHQGSNFGDLNSLDREAYAGNMAHQTLMNYTEDLLCKLEVLKEHCSLDRHLCYYLLNKVVKLLHHYFRSHMAMKPRLVTFSKLWIIYEQRTAQIQSWFKKNLANSTMAAITLLVTYMGYGKMRNVLAFLT